jgi:ABC-type branched-subunit amino acid transport system substrate-binding protein
MNVRLWVYDADNGTGTEKTTLILREPVMKQMNLIIGPLYAPGFAVASRFAATYNIPIVNPLSGREEVLQHNPMVYRVQPSDGQYLTTLARYIRKNYPQANLFLVRQSAYLGSATVETFKKELFSGSQGMMEQIKVQDLIFNRDSTNQFTRGADTSRTNVLVTFSNRRAFISELMGELNNHRNDYDIALFGMPGWENIKLDVEQLMNLNTHIASATCINYNDSLTRWFVQHYRQRFYNEPLPDRYAFVGFDVAWYFLNALWHYGTGFDACLPYLPEQGIERQFRFQRQDDNSGAANKTVYMLRFSDYELQQIEPEE